MPEDFVPKPFRCDVAQLDDTTHLRPEGELDISTVDEVERLLKGTLEGGAKRIVVDLRGLTFMDSTGITLLTRYNNAAGRDGYDLALIQGDERIVRLFSLTGLDEYFTFIPG
ncbi:STAS domain-containing protein [Solirubrobacter taibaiensis]|nr:STAS domain-containing protein [Solirubrobacter taibaiensis]